MAKRRDYTWLLIIPFWVALMSGALSLVREIAATFYPDKVPPSQLFRLCSWGAFVISAAWAWWIEHKKFLTGLTKNEGSRIEGDIIVALVDSKKGTGDGKFEVISSGCFVSLLIRATNINPAPAFLIIGETYLSIGLAGESYEGKYEMLPYGRIDYFTEAAEIHPSSECRNISDFFLSGLQRFPMEDGIPRQGWIRFYLSGIDESNLQNMRNLQAFLKLVLTDTRKKQHPITCTLSLQLNQVQHRSELHN